MTRIRLTAALFAALALGSTAMAAQTPKKPTPVRDSIKAIKKDVKADKAALKKAKKSGDSATVKKLSKDIKADKATKDSLRKKAEAKKPVVPLAAPPKKP